MAVPAFEKHFQAIWHRARNEGPLASLTPNQIRSWAEEFGLHPARAEEGAVGAFGKTKGIVLAVPGREALFPTSLPGDDPEWVVRRRAADRDAALWEKMEWFSPFWVPTGRVRQMLDDVEHCSRERAIELFNYHTSTIYTVAFQAVCVAQIMPAAPSLRESCPLAREAYLAFYSGYRASSIAALIPMIEGSLTRILPNDLSHRAISHRVDRATDRAIATASSIHFGGVWVPAEYRALDYLFGQDERVFAFETFRGWLKRSFFQETRTYGGVTWLNRHLFAHGAATTWQQSANFSRLIVALATTGLVQSWHDGANNVSVIMPPMNEDSTLLWQQALFQGRAQMALKMLEQDHYQKHGRLVPEMPTDNGVLLRKALLADDCINDLVRPLRDAGWHVKVGEPDDEALYMTVAASAADQQFRVALLFSCGTSNAIYRMLDETCPIILYRGSPYHQNEYAHGIRAHVGPVTGWQPPRAPRAEMP